MEEFQSWLSSSSTTSQDEETHSTPTLCDEEHPSPAVSHLCIASINTKPSQINCLAVRNRTLYAATASGINAFDLKTLALVDTFGPGSGLVKSISFFGEKIYTAHQDCKIRVWQQAVAPPNKRKHRLVSTLPTFKDRFLNCLLPKNYVRIRRHERKLWVEHADAVSALAVDDDAELLYSVSWDKCFKIWKISSGTRCLESVKAHSDAVNAVVVSPSDRTVYTGSADGDIKIWTTCGETKRHKLLGTLTEHGSNVNALALTEDGSVLCSGGGDGVILVWEREEKNENNEKSDYFVACCLKGHKGAVLCLVHVHGVLISGSSDRTVRVWKIGNIDNFRGCLAILEGHSRPVKSLVAIRGDDSLDHGLSIFSGSLDGEIRAWKVNTTFVSYYVQ